MSTIGPRLLLWPLILYDPATSAPTSLEPVPSTPAIVAVGSFRSLRPLSTTSTTTYPGPRTAILLFGGVTRLASKTTFAPLRVTMAALRDHFIMPKGPPPDFFVHCWETMFKGVGPDVYTYPSTDVNAYVDIVKPVMYAFEDETKAYNSEEWPKFKGKNGQPSYIHAIGMATSIKRAYELMEAYEKEKGFEYTYVLFTRPDVIHLGDFDVTGIAIEDVVYVNCHRCWDKNENLRGRGNGDFTFFMKRSLATSFSKLAQSATSEHPPVSHSWIQAYVKRNMQTRMQPHGPIPGRDEDVLRKLIRVTYKEPCTYVAEMIRYGLTKDDMMDIGLGKCQFTLAQAGWATGLACTIFLDENSCNNATENRWPRMENREPPLSVNPHVLTPCAWRGNSCVGMSPSSAAALTARIAVLLFDGRSKPQWRDASFSTLWLRIAGFALRDKAADVTAQQPWVDVFAHTGAYGSATFRTFRPVKQITGAVDLPSVAITSLYQLMREEEDARGHPYDIVLLTRPEVIYFESLRLWSNIIMARTNIVHVITSASIAGAVSCRERTDRSGLGGLENYKILKGTISNGGTLTDKALRCYNLARFDPEWTCGDIAIFPDGSRESQRCVMSKHTNCDWTNSGSGGSHMKVYRCQSPNDLTDKDITLNNANWHRSLGVALGRYSATSFVKRLQANADTNWLAGLEIKGLFAKSMELGEKDSQVGVTELARMARYNISRREAETLLAHGKLSLFSFETLQKIVTPACTTYITPENCTPTKREKYFGRCTWDGKTCRQV